MSVEIKCIGIATSSKRHCKEQQYAVTHSNQLDFIFNQSSVIKDDLHTLL